MAPTRALVLGIDAANPDLVERWCDEGRLPNLARLRAGAWVARTSGLEGFFVGSTWPSLYTGTTPARHGVHYLVQLVPGTYRLHRPEEGAFVQAQAYWTALSRAGRRVAILDVPLSRIDPELNGLQVVEWGGHDSIFGLTTRPRGLGQELLDRFGPHPGGLSCDGRRSGASDYRRFSDDLVLGVRRRTALTRWVLDQGPWDLVTQVFSEAHCTSHQCWHLHDSTHPAHDAAVVRELGDPIERVYRAIDDAIGELLEAAPGAAVMVMVGHGMSHWYGAQFLLPEILRALRVTADRAVAAPGWAGRVWDRARDLRRRLFPSAEAAAPPTLSIDPAASKCFVVGNGLAVGGIRINLAGREPLGIVQPGAEADALFDELRRDLLEIVNRSTGLPLVRRVLRTGDLYAGPNLDALPDILVEWNDEVPTGSSVVGNGVGAVVRAFSPKIGTVEGTNDYGRTGEHRPGGMVIAAGPGIRPGRSVDPIRLIDVAPTIAAWFGVALEQADGRPQAELTPEI